MPKRYRGLGAQMAAADRQRIETEKASQVEKVGRLTIYREDGSKPLVKAWRGGQVTPFAFYMFSSVEKREAWIKAQIAAEGDFEGQRQEWRAKRRGAEMQALALTKVGDILYRSWGYDQTNVDFYQVTRKTGARIAVRPISDEIAEQTGAMCGNTMPVKDAFKGEEELVVPGRYSKWEGKPVFTSWYA